MAIVTLADFVRSIADSPLEEIVAVAAEIRRATEVRRDGGAEFLVALDRLVTWLETGDLPAGLTQEERRAYRMLAASLVSKQQMKAVILNYL